MKGFYLRLESTAANCTPAEAIRELVGFAQRIQITVSAEVNGVDVIAHPLDDPDKVIRAWESAAKEGRPFAVAL